jgi:2-methylcitrate dehydratase PrpD
VAFVDDFVHELAARVVATRATPLSLGTRDALARRVFDLTGSIAGGLQTAEAQATLAVLRRLHALESPAYLLGALTVAARSTELDDIDLISCTTPGSVVLPAVLVAGPLSGASPELHAAAVMAGYDVMTALGLALDGANAVYGSRWPTYFGAAMSVAASVATLLELSEERTLTALAIAASMTTPYAGRIATDPISRWLTLAAAAQAGLASALAAAEGLHGDPNIFSSCLGVDDAHVAGARRALDAPAFERTSAKPFCTGRQSLSAIEAFRNIVRDLDPASIERVEVFVPEQVRAMIDRARHARTKSESRGVRYQIALAAYYPGDLFDIDRVTLRVGEAGMTRLIDRIDVSADDELTRLYPRKWAGTVRVHTSAGVRTETVVEPPGDPEHALSWSDIEYKLRAVAAHLPDGIPVDALAAAARALDLRAALAQLTPFAGRFSPPANARR